MPVELVDRVCTALGVPVPADKAGVAALYVAFLGGVPFDPAAKAVALREGRRPPGDDPVEVAERWLASGLGSTCWGHISVLAAILGHAGVRTSFGLDRRLTDEVVDFHSFLLADIDGEHYLLDSIYPSGRLLPFRGGAEGDHPVYRVGLRLDDDRLVHWQETGGPRDGPPYLVISTNLDAADARAFLSVSAIHSRIGGRFYSRRSFPDRVVSFRPTEDGAAVECTTTTAGGETVTLIHDAGEAVAAAGYEPSAVEQLVAGGLLDPTRAAPWTT